MCIRDRNNPLSVGIFVTQRSEVLQKLAKWMFAEFSVAGVYYFLRIQNKNRYEVKW